MKNKNKNTDWKLVGVFTLMGIIMILAGGYWTDKDLKENITVQIAYAQEKELSVRDYVMLEVNKAKIDIYEAYLIIRCESNWKTDIVTIEPNKTTSLGLWQINGIHKNISNADKLDYKAATKWAINKRLKDGNWSAWSCARQLGIK